jgi:serine/threonine protein kinase
MSSRPPAQPPALPSYDFIEPIGTGGFADVYLYQQHSPRRKVAVKVLLARLVGTATEQAFRNEADFQVILANHPSVVSVFETGVAADGRPYIVMEYCPGENLQRRSQQRPFSEAEVLRIGVRIASAVEMAHRRQIFHRDIKPANILFTEYGQPVLADFGIAASTTSEAAGLSVPWAPPEAFTDPPHADARSDVYSLAATLYTLLTGRSPFQVAGQNNSRAAMEERIKTLPVPSLGRHDVSTALQKTLTRSMSKNPHLRQASAYEFALELNRVQRKLLMQETQIEIAEDALPSGIERDVRDRNNASSADDPARAQAPTPSTGEDVAETILKPTRVAEAAPPSVSVRRRSHAAWIASGALALVVAVVVIALIVIPGIGTRPDTDRETFAPADPIEGLPVPPVSDATGSATGAEVVFTWSNPEPQDGDTFLWRDVTGGADPPFAESAESTVTVAVPASGSACIEVLLRRANGKATETATEVCAP